MGVQLGELVEGKEIAIEELFDKKIAVDSFNWLYQFLTIIRQKDGQPLQDSQDRITSHLSGLFYRSLKLMEAGIHPVYVFDGPAPAFKKETTRQRTDIRLEAKKEWQEALARKDFAEARKHAQRSAMVTEEIIADSKNLLDAMGIPVIQASSEGEALCSAMVRNNDAYAAATQDYDSLLFGCPRLVRNLSITGKKKRGDSYIIINPEILLLKDFLSKLDITQDQLITLGILVGTDYNPGGIKGFGPKKALELVKKRKIKEIKEEIIWDFPATFEEIFDFFKNPPVNEYNIEFRPPDKEKIKRILCDEHDFSEERIDNALQKLSQEKKQKSLHRFF
jgi:flap endonuclease-1